MRIYRPYENTTQVTLSQRNLLTLLQKLEDPDSSRMLIIKQDDHALIVKAETDEEHYTDREPGPMNARVMAFVEGYRAWRKFANVIAEHVRGEL